VEDILEAKETPSENFEMSEELPEITPEEMALKLNKLILEKGKLPKKFSIMDGENETPDIIEFDKKLKLYNKYKIEENDKRRNGETIKKRFENTVVCRYEGKELMKMIENNEIFVMMVF
jgi:RNase P/RNase MRP subunit p30